MKTTEEMIEVMQAFARGEKIEARSIRGTTRISNNPTWNWRAFDYRIAPEQRPAAEEKTP